MLDLEESRECINTTLQLGEPSEVPFVFHRRYQKKLSVRYNKAN